jgi:beta-glucosidase
MLSHLALCISELPMAPSIVPKALLALVLTTGSLRTPVTADAIVLSDNYFAGSSPPVYPSPQGVGSSTWEQAYVKAEALVGNLTVEEKVHHPPPP